jgi:hypothetical protein
MRQTLPPGCCPRAAIGHAAAPDCRNETLVASFDHLAGAGGHSSDRISGLDNRSRVSLLGAVLGWALRELRCAKQSVSFQSHARPHSMLAIPVKTSGRSDHLCGAPNFP